MQKDEKLVQKRKGQKSFLTRRSYQSYIYNFFKTKTFSINIKKEKGKYIKNRKNITALRGIQEMAKKNGNEEREEECIRT